MSKFLLYTDVHFCENSSSVQSRGEKYSTRLEYLIKSVNWAEQQAVENNCEAIICLGDFFNRSDINSEEATALQEINWADLTHYFIIGNHDGSNKSLVFNSVEVLRKLPNFKLITEPTAFGKDMMFLPYIKDAEVTDTTLRDTWNATHTAETDKKIIFSHNSVKGIQMGPVISKEGIDINEIDSFCTMFINGHLHNGTKFSKKGINLGNLTGQNFGEDAFRYEHDVFILDTDDCSLIPIENPYAFNFYQLEIKEEKDINKISSLKNNAVISIKCNEKYADTVRETLKAKGVIASRLLTTRETSITSENNIDELINTEISHLDKFVACAKESLNNTEILEYELSKICSNVE